MCRGEQEDERCSPSGARHGAAAGVSAAAGARRLAYGAARLGRGGARARWARVGFGAQERAAAVYAAARALQQRILMTKFQQQRHRDAPASPQTSKNRKKAC